MAISVQVCGAARTVTGYCLLFDTGRARFLVDCGMFQGPKTLKSLNWKEFPFNPYDIDAVLPTHAHIDHSGLLPKLKAAGCGGVIHATAAMVGRCAVMLPDSGPVQEMGLAQFNRRNRRKARAPTHPIYTVVDAEAVIPTFRATPFGHWL